MAVNSGSWARRIAFRSETGSGLILRKALGRPKRGPLVVAEDAVRQGVRAAADDQVDFRAGLELVPIPLHFAEDGGVAALEALEFVDRERQRMFAREVQDPFEDVPETHLFAGQENSELAVDLVLGGRAKFLLAPPCHEEVQVQG